MDKPAVGKRKAWRPFQSIGRPTLGSLRGDVVAGVTLAAIAIPEQMATARLGGFSPALGLYAFVAASVAFAAFGYSRRISAGADSTVTPIFAGGLAALAAAGTVGYGQNAALLALMVGALVAGAGMLRLGWMADLLSKPVLTGFLAGIAVHIVLSQAPAVLGLPEESGDVFHRMAQLVATASHAGVASLAIGLGVFGATWGLEKLSPRIPGALVALIAAAALAAMFRLDRHGVFLLGRLEGGTLSFGLPDVPLQRALPLLSLAAITALVIMVQTAATSRSFSDPGEDPDVNRDYVGMGAASLLSGLIGGFPVNASPPRTAAASQAGAGSQVCGLVAAGLVAALAAFGAGLLAGVPTAALGGVLLFVAQRIFRLRVFRDLIRPSPVEFGLAVLTAVLIVLLPIQTGVAIGVFLSLAHGAFTVTRTQLIPFKHQPGGTVWWPVTSARAGETLPGVVVQGFQAPLSFLNAYDFRRGMLQALADAPAGTRLIVLEAGSMVDIDFTASEVLLELIATARKAGMDFAVARLESVRAQVAFDRFGVTDALGSGHIFDSVDQAIRNLARPSDVLPS